MLTPAFATPPTVTTTLPVVAPAGTGTTMFVTLQLVGVAPIPLKVTVLDRKSTRLNSPHSETSDAGIPLVGLRPVMLGGGTVTVKLTPLLATPPTVTTTFP